MIHAEEGRELVTDHVRRPVVNHALRDPAVQRLRRCPHDVGARGVVVGLFHDDAAVVNEHSAERLGVAVLHIGI